MELTDLDKLALAQYTTHEKQCIYQAIYAAMLSDGDTGNSELALMNEMVNMFGLTQEELDESKALVPAELTRDIRDMNYLKRLHVGVLLKRMVMADAVVTQREKMFIQHFYEKFNIPAEDVERL
jgi:uncharacterized tellurite resistance protein B-like protein